MKINKKYIVGAVILIAFIAVIAVSNNLKKKSVSNTPTKKTTASTESNEFDPAKFKNNFTEKGLSFTLTPKVVDTVSPDVDDNGTQARVYTKIKLVDGSLVSPEGYKGLDISVTVKNSTKRTVRISQPDWRAFVFDSNNKPVALPPNNAYNYIEIASGKKQNIVVHFVIPKDITLNTVYLTYTEILDNDKYNKVVGEYISKKETLPKNVAGVYNGYYLKVVVNNQ